MRKITLILSSFLLLSTFSVLRAQQGNAQVAVVAFYNLENLFDTIDDPNKKDEDFTPTGPYRYTGAIYQEKLQHLSTVISQLGTDVNPDGVAIMGCAEVENRKVLEDLCHQPLLEKRNLQVIHLEGPDERSVDPGFIYNPRYFQPSSAKGLFVDLKDHDDLADTSKYYTRDILWITGKLNGDLTHIFVMHWPSRRGGEEASMARRAKAAETARKIIDSLQSADPNVKIIAMGDLNDDPTSPSLTEHLRAKGKKEDLTTGDLFNPYWTFYKKGIGTLAWGDAWNLFDNITLSQPYLNMTGPGYHWLRSEVFNKNFLVQKTGNFKGYPNRTYVGTEYVGGYSDHFPVITYLAKDISKP